MPAEINKRLLFGNSTSSVFERLVNVFVVVWLHQYLVKRISPEEYAIYPVVAALLLFVPPLTTIMISGLHRYVVEADALGNAQRVTQIVSSLIPILLGVAVVLLCGGVAFARHIGSVLTIAPQWMWDAQFMLMLLLLSVSLQIAFAPFASGLYVKQRFVLLNALAVCQAILRLTLLMVLMFGIGPRVLWVVVASVTSEIALVMVTTILSRRAMPALRFRWKEARWDLVNVLTRFGFWSMLGHMAYMIRKSSGPLILNNLGTPLNVACFHLGGLADNHIEGTVRRAASPLQPTMVAMRATGNQQSVSDCYLWAGRYCLWAALFVATPLIVFRHELWSLYLGRAYGMYGDAAVVMALLLARYWIAYPNEILIGMVAHATNRMRTLAILAVLGSFLNIALTLYLVGVLRMGAVGSALATLVITAVWEPFVMWRFSLGILGLGLTRWLRETIGPGLLPAIVTTISGYFISLFVRPGDWATLTLLVIVCSAVYLWCLVAFCLSKQESDALARFSARIRLALVESRLAGGK